MNRNLLLTLAVAAAFGAVALGAVVGDAVRDTAGPAAIPAAVGDPLPLLPGLPPPAPDEPLVPDTGYAPVEVAAEFVATATGSGASGGDDAAPSDPPPPEAGVSWEESVFSGVDFTDLLFGLDEFPFLRFVDFCADTPEDEACPFGMGGTVLAPFDHDLAPVGPFDLRDSVYTTRAGWWTCAVPSSLRDTEYFLLLSATHPARLEISWEATDGSGLAGSTVIDYTDHGHRVFTDFLAVLAETGAPPATGVHHCFVLPADRAQRTYRIDVAATSFTGETDTESYTLLTDEQRRRPPITVAPLSDYEVTIAVPVIGEPLQRSLVRVILPDEVDADTGYMPSCTDIEDDVLENRRNDVVPWAPGTPYSAYRGREDIGREIVEAVDWRYDPAYDAYEFWTLNLQEGTTYRLCVWWMGSDGIRSFDPPSAAVRDRESRWITTPDRLRAEIRVGAIGAPTNADVPVAAFRISGSGCPTIDLPTVGLARDTGIAYTGGLPLCDFRGYAQPATTEIRVAFPDGDRKTFLVATPNTGEPRTERVRLDLSRERTSGLCGSSFGECTPPTSTVPGALVFLDVTFSEGTTSGRDDWVVSAPMLVEPPERAPTELPEAIQIDVTGSRVLTRDRESLTVVAEFDRPVSLVATIDGDPDTLCLTGSPPLATADAVSATHTLILTGLCTYTGYLVRLEATDAAGTTTVFRGEPTESGEVFWGGWGITDGWHVEYQVNSLSALTGGYYLRVFAVDVSHLDWSLAPESRCLTTYTRPFEQAVWGDTVTVEVRIGVVAGTRDGEICRGYGDEWQGSVTTTFTIDEFRELTSSGGVARFVIAVPLEPASRGAPPLGSGAVAVVVQGRLLP